jgi:hypothetical protein
MAKDAIGDAVKARIKSQDVGCRIFMCLQYTSPGVTIVTEF